MFLDFLLWTFIAMAPIVLYVGICKRPPNTGDMGSWPTNNTESQQQRDLFGLLDYHARDAFINHDGSNPINRLKGDK